MRSANCGVNAECGMRSAECGEWSAECGMSDGVGCHEAARVADIAIPTDPSGRRYAITAAIPGNESTSARPAFGPSTKAAFDVASASVPSRDRMVTLSDADDGCSVRGSRIWSYWRPPATRKLL